MKKLLEYMRQIGKINSVNMLLEWDQETNMPSQGLAIRAETNQMLHEMHHKAYSSKKLSKLLEPFIDIKTGEIDPALNQTQQALVREIRKDHLRTIKIPSSLVKKFAAVKPACIEAWKEAKRTNKFGKFAPLLKKIIALSQKQAECLGYEDHPYDALLDQYEPGMTQKKLNEIFGPLKVKQKKILEGANSHFKNAPEEFFHGEFPVDTQKILSHKVMNEMGLKKEYYHFGEAVHPFCLSLNPGDIRVTTHFYSDHLIKGFSATMHECGHALYEHQLPVEYFGTPLTEAASFGIHESQSRFWECFIGNSMPFWKHYYPIVKELFPRAFKENSLQEFYYAINRVEPSLIRIFADELTYNLHIVLRYEIERSLIDGSLKVSDLPDAFAAKMHELLGIKPKDIATGCAQDVHWSMGAFGYFPSYALGNLYAGSLFVKMIQEHTNWDQRVAKGDLQFINQFMKEKIHRYGRQFTPLELIEKATGKPFSPSDYISYLEGKF